MTKKTVILLCVWGMTVVICLVSLISPRYTSASEPAPTTYEVRSRLLMEAMDFVGVCFPSDAAIVWAEGLKRRSAAMQYSVMNSSLKDEYARQLDEVFPNWVTGASSPWVESYKITGTESPDEQHMLIELKFDTATSTGYAGSYSAKLTLEQRNCFWRISAIEADEGLYPYTGFTMPTA